MKLKDTNLLVGLALAFLTVWTCPSLAEMEYRDRGDRYEGVKQRPVSGYDIEVISVLIDHKETATQLPDWFKLKFFLEQSYDVYITVRELDYKYYYWMDKVRPPKPWQQGFSNDFSWPTREVIKQLGNVKISDFHWS